MGGPTQRPLSEKIVSPDSEPESLTHPLTRTEHVRYHPFSSSLDIARPGVDRAPDWTIVNGSRSVSQAIYVRQQARLTRLYLPFSCLSLMRFSQSLLGIVGYRHHVPSAYKMHLISTFSLYRDAGSFPKSLTLTTRN
jgi:hypothetical protein